MPPDTSIADASPSPDLPGDDPSIDPSEMTEIKSDRDHSEDKSPTKSQDGSETTPSVKKNAKDPSRPRRKKARRACFACQRAHLTCGDERPCLRCVKRGLAEHCHDGMRKKAKYLHDAPAEALVPGLGGTYHASPPPAATNATNSNDTSAMAQPHVFYPSQISPVDVNGFNKAITLGGQTQSPGGDNMIDPFQNQQPLHQGNFAPSNRTIPQLQQNPGAVNSNVQQNPPPQYNDNTPFIDPTDPSFFNFDISGLNFGNQYGALEFGMLGHMASGAGDTPDDSSNLIGSMNNQGPIPFDSSTSPQAYSTAGPNYNNGNNNNNSNFPYGPYSNSINVPSRRNSTGHAYSGVNLSQPDPNGSFGNAFAIGEGTGSISSASPNNTTIDFPTYGTSPIQNNQFFTPRGPQHDLARQAHQHRAAFPTADPTDTNPRKRKRDPSHIYSSVQAPYSYTTGFHSLTAFIQKRFSAQKTLRIAKALASIRPSFIACTKELNRDDLIFMEKCFQRTLLQYEDFLNAYGCPTLICRRTGEVAAVSKEFSLLTGWRRDVLLGKDTNLNVNNGGTSGTVTRGSATPSKPSSAAPDAAARPQPVFLAELLDDDSVIGFYEDFAKLAFGDSRGYVVKPCSLLKYRTKDDKQPIEEGANGQTALGGMNVLGEREGKVNCMFCWAVKRDVFDIPMMVVMNFLPCI